VRRIDLLLVELKHLVARVLLPAKKGSRHGLMTSWFNKFMQRRNRHVAAY
jgi:hypothetical protein